MRVCLSVCLLQACRGNELDPGVLVDDDDDDATAEQPSPAQRIPIEADYLYAYSTVAGLYNRVKVAHTRLPSVVFRSLSRFLAVSLQVT